MMTFGQSGRVQESKTEIKVSGNSQKKTFDFNGELVQVSGSDHTITINGSSNQVKISGSGNTVYVDKVNKVQISGSENTVRYKTSDNKNKKPTQNVTGFDNSVVKE